MALATYDLTLRMIYQDGGVQKSVANTEKGLNSLKSTALAAGAAITAALSVGTIAQQILELDSAEARLAAQIGATREEAEAFSEVARDIYASKALGDSIGEIGDNLSKVKNQFKELGIVAPAEIGAITTVSAQVQRTFSADFDKTTQSIRVLMKEFGLSAEEASNFIAGGFHRGLNASDDFLDSIAEYGNQFAQGGADAGQFFSTLESGLAGGVLGTDKAGDMFKEFQARIIDGSKATKEGLEMLGLSSDNIADKINSKQMTVADAFELVQEKLRGTADASTQMQAGVNLLGTQFEDLGINAALAVDMSAVKMADLAGSMDAVSNAAQQDASVKFTAAWRTFLVEIAGNDNLQALANGLADVALAAAEATPHIIEAAKVVGVGGLLYVGMTKLPVAAAAAGTAFTTLSRTYGILTASSSAVIVPTSRLDATLLAMKYNVASQPTLWAKLNTSIYGTGVASQFASGWMGKLQVAGGLAVAAFAGWEIGSYLYEEFEWARLGGVALVSSMMVGAEELSYQWDSSVNLISNVWSVSMHTMGNRALDFVDNAGTIFFAIPALFSHPMDAVSMAWNMMLSKMSGNLSSLFEGLASTAFKLDLDIAGDLYEVSEGFRKTSLAQKQAATTNNEFAKAFDASSTTVKSYTAGLRDQLPQIDEYEKKQRSLDSTHRANINTIDDLTSRMKEEVKADFASKDSKADLSKIVANLGEDYNGLKKQTNDARIAGEEEKKAVEEQKKALKDLQKTLEEAQKAIAVAGMTDDQKKRFQLDDRYGSSIGALVYDAEKAGEAIDLLRGKRLELQKVGLSDQQQKELELSEKYGESIAAQVFQIDQLITAREKLNDAQQDYAASGLTQDAREYLALMKEVGAETGKQIILLQQQAEARNTGADRIASLREEITLLQLSAEEQEQYNALKDIAPEQRDAVKSLIDQKQVLADSRAHWEGMTDSAVNYLEKVATGELSLKDAFKGFMVDFNKDNLKKQMTQLKENLVNWFNGGDSVTVDSALKVADAQVQKDVQAATAIFEQYEQSLKVGTDGAAQTLIDGVDASIAKLSTAIDVSLSKVSAELSKVSSQVAETAKATATSVETLAQSFEGLGSLSAKYESGGRGAGTVSTGKGDYGGVSYGTYQLSSKMGTADAFVKSITDTYFGQALSGLKSGSAAFSAKWKELAAKDADKFGQLQHDYIKKTLYDPLVKSADKLGVDLQARSKTLNDVVWSTGVQHGGGSSIVNRAIKNVGANASDEELIKAIYDLRADVRNFKSSSKDVQQSVMKRFANEEKDALKQLAAESKAAAAAQKEVSAAAQVQVATTTQATVSEQIKLDTTNALNSTLSVQAEANTNAAASVQALAQASVGSAQMIAQGATAVAQTTGEAAQAIAQAGSAAATGASTGGGGGLFDSMGKLFSGDGMLGSVGKLFSGDGALGGIGKLFSGDGALGGISKLFSGGGGGMGGLLSAGMSLVSGDWQGALSGALTTGLTALGGPIGSALGMAVGPVMGKLFGSWEVEAQHLTAEVSDLSAAFQMKTIEVNKGMIGGGKRETYSELDKEQNAQLQAAMESVVNQIEDVSAKIGKTLTDNFKFSHVIDTVHEDTDDFETQFARMQSIMIKNAFTESNIAGVDTDIQSVMSDRVSNVMKSAADGLFDKSLQKFMWKPDTQKYSEQIKGPVQDGLNDLIAGTDWTGLDVEGRVDTLQGYLTDAFASAGVNVPADTFQNMAEMLAEQIGNGLAWLDDNQGIVDPDAGFFKNMRQIVENFNEWDANPEEVSAFINSLLDLKDAFKLVGYDAGLISQELIDASGDVGALTSNLDAFYSNFLSEEEQRSNKLTVLSDNLTRSFDNLGLEMPATASQFRQMVGSMASDMADPALFADTIALSSELAEYFDLLGGGIASVTSGLDGFIAQIDTLAQSLTAQDVGNWLRDAVLNAQNADDAGNRFSAAFATAFQEQMLNTVLSTVSNMVFSGLVQPMMEASVMSANNTIAGSATASQQIAMGGSSASVNMSAGGSSASVNMSVGGGSAAAALAAGGQMAADYIAGVVGQVKTVLSVMSEVMADETVQGMIKDLQPALSDIGSSTYNMVSAAPITSPVIQQSYASNYANTTSNNSSSSAADTEKPEEPESVADFRKALKLFETGLEDTELKLYEIKDVFNGASFDITTLTGSAEDMAATLNALDDDKLRAIAAETGISVDELEGYAMDYLNIMREQAQGWEEFTGKMSDAARGLGDLDDLSRDIVQLEDKFAGLDITALALNIDAKEAARRLAEMPLEEASAHAEGLGLSLSELQENAELVVTAIDDLQAKFADFREQVREFSSKPLDAGAEVANRYGVDLTRMDSRKLADQILNASDTDIATMAAEFGVTIDQLMGDALTLLDATKVQTEAFDTFTDNLKSAGASLRDTVKSLKLGDLSTLTNKQKLDQSQSQVDELYKLAAAGDTEAAKKLESELQTLLTLGREYYGSSDNYTQLFDKYTGMADTLGMAYEAAGQDSDLAGMFMDASVFTSDQITNKLNELKDEYGLSTEAIVGAIKGGYFGLSDEQQAGVFTNMTGNKAGVTDAQINSAITDVAGSGSFSEGEIAAMIREQMVNNGISAEQVARSVGVSMQDYTAFMDQQIGAAVNGLMSQVQSGAMGADSAIAQLKGAMERFGIGREELSRSTGIDLRDVEAFADQHGLPKMAEGGYVDKPTLALIGEAGPEMVVPLKNGNNGGQSNAELKALLQRMLEAEQETQRILNAILQNNQQHSAKALNELQQQPKKTALLLGQKIEALRGK